MQTSKKYISFTHTMQSIYLFGGFGRFWTGSFLIGSASVPAHALYFSVYEMGKKTYGVEKSGFQFVASALTGATATFFHDMILTPADSIYYLQSD
jgi:solute carrier family 25 iron transporter 28/37